MTLRRLRLVCLSRQYGSGGAAVARALAQRLGFRLLDRDLIDEVARAAEVPPDVARGLDEQLDPWSVRLARSLWHGAFEGVAAVGEEQLLDAERLAALTRRIVLQAAELGGCVIVGRGAAAALAGRGDVLSAFVYAPRAERARRLRERLGPQADVARAMEAVDGERAAYLRHHYGRDWHDLELYDVLVSSARGDEAAVETLLAAVRAFDQRA